MAGIDPQPENGHVGGHEVGEEEGTNWEVWTDVHTLLRVKKIARGKLLYIPGSSAQCSVMI